MIKIPAVWMRGGTSKGLFFHEQDLPCDPKRKTQFLLAAIGSPDPYRKQMDGMGGATSSTSKVVIIKRSERSEIDVDYTFGHVSIDQAIIDWSGNCGNLTAAVAHFAIEEQLIKREIPSHGQVTINIWQTNLQQHIQVSLILKNGLPQYEGDDVISGVSGTASACQIKFFNPSMGPTLPTGHATDQLQLNGHQSIEASLIDAGNPTIFVTASSFSQLIKQNITACESVSELDQPPILEMIELIRCHGAIKMGLAIDMDQAKQKPAIPKVALIAEPQDYITSHGSLIRADQVDICARIFSLGLPHHAFTGTGAIATAIAALIPNTLVAKTASKSRADTIRIAHPSGMICAGGCIDTSSLQAKSAHLVRTARRIMDGHVYLPIAK